MSQPLHHSYLHELRFIREMAKEFAELLERSAVQLCVITIKSPSLIGTGA